MSKILIWKQTAPGCEYDIFTSTDYRSLYNHVKNNWEGICKNWGNRLWFQGIYSALDNGENEYDFITDDINIDKINSIYDKIVLPMANIFYSGHIKSIRLLADIFEKIKIPTFVVVCGVQADSYDSLNEVIASIGEESKRFIRAIYNTGGEFALRGYFTKEFFERLGFPSAVVTGCPSIFQLGPDFIVDDQKVNTNDILPLFNGDVKSVSKLTQEYHKSIFIDQCTYFPHLFQEDYLKNINFKFLLSFYNNYGIESARLLSEGRIYMIADMNDWWNFLKNSNYNYSFGSRIHGTIMSLLSGIPATIVTLDSRTREMAEFFGIPNVVVDGKHRFSVNEFKRLYCESDYSEFNKGFKDKYRNYEKFLVDYGIVSKVNTKNRFFTQSNNDELEMVSNINKDEFKALYEKLNDNRLVLSVASSIKKIMKKGC